MESPEREKQMDNVHRDEIRITLKLFSNNTKG